MASFFPYLVWLLLLQLPLLTCAQTSPNVTLGSSLSALDGDNNPSWNSPSSDFSFGFRPTIGGLFLLSIWFDKIPEKTIVWTANGDQPVPKGSRVQLTSSGVLSLTTPNRTEVWKRQASNNGQPTSAAMLNSGNFVLIRNDSTIVWGSFEEPTDTLLPTQTLDRGGSMTSRLSDEIYSPGKFQLILQFDDGNLALHPFARPTSDIYDAYWESHTVGNGSKLIFNQSGYIYLSLLNGSQYMLTAGIPVSTREFYHRFTLDYDGVLRQYTFPKSSIGSGSGSWSFKWTIPVDICTANFGKLGSGVCGLNSYCKLQNQRATCECPPGYIYSHQNNKFGGCKQDFVPPSCGGDKSRVGIGYEMAEVRGADWPQSDYEWYKSVNEDWCKETCLNDCLCAAAITRESNCWLKKFPLSTGKTDLTRKALIKVGNSSSVLGSSPGSAGNGKDRDTWGIPAVILLGSSASLNLLLLSLITMCICWLYHKKQVKTTPNTSAFGVNLTSFTYKELEEATSGFKEELGQGAYSTVYKGSVQLVTGSSVAVKRFDKLVQHGDKGFKAEVNAIGRTNHKNLVQLLGFCDEGTHHLLVYEYMRNGSLADFLFGSSRPDWSLRIQIAFGIARGLAYLHEDCSNQIIHCDVKPQNILLDDTFMAKISDFGLAKLLKGDQTRTNTGIRGTKGYVAPEWFKNMAITAKVDVYSFGIMLLEIICCQKNVEMEMGSEEINALSDWAYECCMERTFHLLVEDDEDAKNDRRLERLVMVAIWCIQENPSLRPSMKKVTQMLEGAVEVSMPPCPSFISSIG